MVTIEEYCIPFGSDQVTFQTILLRTDSLSLLSINVGISSTFNCVTGFTFRKSRIIANTKSLL